MRYEDQEYAQAPGEGLPVCGADGLVEEETAYRVSIRTFSLVKIKKLPVYVRDLFFPLRTQLGADKPMLPVVFPLPQTVYHTRYPALCNTEY